MLLALGAAGLLVACSSPPPASIAPDPVEAVARQDAEIYRRADLERARVLEAEVARLRAELEEAEQYVVAIESGLTGHKTRADAVAATAAARVQLERARRGAAWQTRSIDEATEKLAEAERQLEGGTLAAAMFFASRADRIATQILEEARIASSASDARKIDGARVNLREGPSQGHEVLAVLIDGTPVVEERVESDWVLVRTPRGRVGWVHDSLLD